MDNNLKIVTDKMFEKVRPSNYAKELKTKFLYNPSLWYKVILPASKGAGLVKATNNDYSEIWEEHCAVCFKHINKDIDDDFYVSKDRFTWICKECFEKLKEQNGWSVEEN